MNDQTNNIATLSAAAATTAAAPGNVISQQPSIGGSNINNNGGGGDSTIGSTTGSSAVVAASSAAQSATVTMTETQTETQTASPEVLSLTLTARPSVRWYVSMMKTRETLNTSSIYCVPFCVCLRRMLHSSLNLTWWYLHSVFFIINIILVRDETVVNNEGMGRKSSKRCCIFHKQRAFGESSTESDYDSDKSGDGNNGKKGKIARPKKKDVPDHQRYHA